MNLHALRIFKVVAEFESVTKAANYLCLSQPAVTIQIRHLEKELDVALLQTRGRGIQLTEIGKVLAKEADKLFSLEASIVSVVDAFDAMTTNRVYRGAMTFEEAILEIKRGRGTQFNPKVLDEFLEMLQEKNNQW
ncbi:MAG: LysR family transcriptional regulator [Psychrobacillus sp.]